MIGEDVQRQEVVLGMVESRPWDGSELRLFQLQEKINAYISFALDGELRDAYPELAEKPVRLRLDCATAPDPATAAFLEAVRVRMGFQGIRLEVRIQRPKAELPE
jgi:hypothetical protein